jgi:L-asparagine oxygenase
VKRFILTGEVGLSMSYNAEYLASRNLVSARISPGLADREELLRLAKYVTADPGRAPEDFCAEARRAAVYLPNSIAEFLRNFHRCGSPSGAVLISGLPVDDAPSTPADNRQHLGQRTMLARMQAILNEFLGSMVAYEAEGGGRLFQDMVPSRAAAMTQTSLSSTIELQVHTEQAFSDLRPDYLSLACLRDDPCASTLIITAKEIARRCTPEEVELLRQPQWTTTIDESFLGHAHHFEAGLTRGPMPVLYGAHDDPFMTFDQDLMRGTDQAAQDLLGRLISAYVEGRSAYTLRVGDVLILDNKRAAHGRSDFIARFDSTDRFVIRSFVVRDLDRSRHARAGDSRLVLASFS